MYFRMTMNTNYNNNIVASTYCTLTHQLYVKHPPKDLMHMTSFKLHNRFCIVVVLLYLYSQNKEERHEIIKTNKQKTTKKTLNTCPELVHVKARIRIWAVNENTFDDALSCVSPFS